MRKKRNRYNLMFLALFLMGFVILMYPVVGERWNRYRGERLINNYETGVQQAEPEDFSQMLEDARAYNRGQMGNPIPDVFAVAEGQVDTVYESLLNLNQDGIMGYLEIPVIEVRLPIFHGTGEEALTRGVGHLKGSALPVGGESTHAVLAAHRGLPSAKLFTDLNLVQEGDSFYIHVLDQVIAYEVDQILIVEPEETSSLAAEEGADYVTLVTCTPYGVNTQRLLVRGHRVEYDPAVYEAAKQETRTTVSTSYVAIPCVGLLVVILAGLLMYLRNRRKVSERNEGE